MSSGIAKTERPEAGDPLKPTATVLCKLGSIAVHVEEAMSRKGHAFDVHAMRGLLNDAEVKQWLKAMDELAMLPVRR